MCLLSSRPQVRLLPGTPASSRDLRNYRGALRALWCAYSVRTVCGVETSARAVGMPAELEAIRESCSVLAAPRHEEPQHDTAGYPEERNSYRNSPFTNVRAVRDRDGGSGKQIENEVYAASDQRVASEPSATWIYSASQELKKHAHRFRHEVSFRSDWNDSVVCRPEIARSLSGPSSTRGSSPGSRAGTHENAQVGLTLSGSRARRLPPRLRLWSSAARSSMIGGRL